MIAIPRYGVIGLIGVVVLIAAASAFSFGQTKPGSCTALGSRWAEDGKRALTSVSPGVSVSNHSSPQLASVNESTLELLRWLPPRPANSTNRIHIPLRRGPSETASLPDAGESVLQVAAGNVFYRSDKRIVPDAAAVAVLLAPEPGQLPLDLTVCGLNSGSFQVPIRVTADHLDEQFTLFVDVKDAPLMPWLAILCGVAASFLYRFWGERYAPRQELLSRILPLTAELERWNLDTRDAAKLAGFQTKLSSIRTRLETEDPERLSRELGAVEREIGQERQARAKHRGNLRQRLDDIKSTLQRLAAIGAADRKSIDASLERAEAAVETDRLGDAASFLDQAEQDLRSQGREWYGQLIELISRKLETLTPQEARGSANSRRLAAARKYLEAAQFEEVQAQLQPLITMLTTHGATDEELDELLRQRSGRAAKLELVVSPSRGATVGQAVRLSLPAGVASDLVVDWGFGDGSTDINTRDTSKVHVYRAPAEYIPEATIHGDSGAENYAAHILVTSEPSVAAASAAQRRRRDALFAVGTIAMLVASLSGLQLLYIGKPFGSLADYIVALLWGFGTERAVVHTSNRVTRRSA